MSQPLPRIVVCADAARWGTERCVQLAQRLAPVAPRGALSVWDRDPATDPGSTPLGERLKRLEVLRQLTLDHGQALIVGARTDLAATVNADGVHLPEHGVNVTSVLRSFPTLSVSRSCHDRLGLQRAQEEGASWATLSPFRAPRSKSSARVPLGEEEFRRHTAGLELPVVALGGLDLTDVIACKRAGSVGLAVSGALFESTKPERLLESFLEAWREAL